MVQRRDKAQRPEAGNISVMTGAYIGLTACPEAKPSSASGQVVQLDATIRPRSRKYIGQRLIRSTTRRRNQTTGEG